MTIAPPGPEEYAPFQDEYVARVRDRDPFDLLRSQPLVLRNATAGLSDSDALDRYAEGKWSIKEVVGHLSDTERVLSYRLMRVARGDVTPLPGFDEVVYVATADFDSRPLTDLVEDFVACRASTVRLVEGLKDDVWSNTGVASNFPMTARGLLYVIPGHVAHHFRLLGERYGMQGFG